MKIRNYITTDCENLCDLFFDTVHTINAKDYSKIECQAWATGKIDIPTLNKSFLENNTLVVEKNNIIVGFGDMDNTGYLDRLYVHKDFQRQGIAKLITSNLEKHAIDHGISTFTTYASITSLPFFKKQGYIVICDNIVYRNDVKLRNFVMKKQLFK
ncbi:MAG: GNAT family N-acetyltransferase [Clostridia bacterium]